jgi:hypothetical protein
MAANGGVIDLTVQLTPKEAGALKEMCRRFQYGDAQHLLRHGRNVRPDHLCEAVTRVLAALTAAGVGSRSGPASEGRVTVAFEVARADVAASRRFVEALLAATSR